jgi:hypothetical protein
MLLDLINGPFVPLDVISSQESPVPLLKFQMAPQTFNVLWVQEKGTQICIFFFSQKSQ